jgi:hypothetical protein
LGRAKDLLIAAMVDGSALRADGLIADEAIASLQSGKSSPLLEADENWSS